MRKEIGILLSTISPLALYLMLKLKQSVALDVSSDQSDACFSVIDITQKGDREGYPQVRQYPCWLQGTGAMGKKTRRCFRYFSIYNGGN